MTRETPYVWANALPIVADFFTFPHNNWTYRAKGTGNWLLNISLSGGGTVVVGGTTIEAKPGHIFLYAPNTQHNFGTRDSSWATLWCHFLCKADWMPFLAWPKLAEGVYAVQAGDTHAFKKIIVLAKKTVRHTHGGNEFGRYFAMNALEELLLTIVDAGLISGKHYRDERLTKALEYMATNLHAIRRIEQLASVAGMSVSRFQHLFRKELSCTPIEYLETRRIERAKIRLAITTEPIESIAAEVGYASTHYFYRRFKQATGKPPGAFRKESIST